MAAIFARGNPLMCPYVPGADIAEGDVVVAGELPCVCHRPIANGGNGNLAVGGGTYNVPADGALAAGAIVYWDNAAGKVTGTAGVLKVFGYIAPGSSAASDGDIVEVVHRPATP